MIAKVACPAAFAACTDVKLSLKATGKKKFTVASGKLGKIKGGKSAKLKLKLTGKAKKALKKKPKLKVSTKLTISEIDDAVTKNATVVGKKKHKKK